MPAYDGPALWHMGYIKTGSTFLQQSVFTVPDGPFALADGERNRWHMMDTFRAHNDYSFDAAGHAAHFATLEQPLREQGRIPVWSDETMLGNPLRRIYCGPDVLRRLTEMRPPAKILITIREQKRFALSAFRESARRHRYSLRDFIGRRTEELAMRPVLRPEFMEYHHAVKAYFAAFGAENCLVLPLEMLSQDPQAYLERLCRFMGTEMAMPVDMTPQNVGLGGTALVVSRSLNRFYDPPKVPGCISLPEWLVRRGVSLVNRLAPARLDARIEADWKARIAERYAGVYEQSNAELSSLSGLDLKAFGYT